MFGLDAGLTILLILCLLAVCAFEFINGFHDTANAVATVIYTKSLKPKQAVVWSGILNFAGLLLMGTSVAMGIINLLPLEAIVDQNIYHGVALVGVLLLTAIIWNLGTWYFGIPCSSSHTLIGSIFGVGLAFTFLPGNEHIVLNWKKLEETGLYLFISPVFGFVFSMLMLLLMKKVVKKKKFFKEPDAEKKPPFFIRLTLIITSSLVSFFHGSNDGQKGIGLAMIILILFAPSYFAIKSDLNPQDLLVSANNISNYINKIDSTKIPTDKVAVFTKIKKNLSEMAISLVAIDNFKSADKKINVQIRTNILSIGKAMKGITEDKTLAKLLPEKDVKSLGTNIKQMKEYTEYAPKWVIIMISICIGFGTMIGWKRIVVTIGEKIGKTHLSYAQGASAELIAASTIGMSTFFGMPVSTTHVLSSGVAGTMVGESGRSNLQPKTIKNIAIAWIVTLPVTILMAGGLFLLFRMLIGE
ncbi:MAG: inorganic phosphate transporter [Bacteroidota bacterium]